MTTIDQLSRNKQKKLHDQWRSGHSKKRAFPSRYRAWVACMQLRRDKRRFEVRLHPYRCTWGDDWRDRQGYRPHWHIGHSKWGAWGMAKRRWRRARVRRRLLHLFVYPWLRLRSRLRFFLRTGSLKRHDRYHSKPGRIRQCAVPLQAARGKRTRWIKATRMPPCSGRWTFTP